MQLRVVKLEDAYLEFTQIAKIPRWVWCISSPGSALSWAVRSVNPWHKSLARQTAFSRYNAKRWILGVNGICSFRALLAFFFTNGPSVKRRCPAFWLFLLLFGWPFGFFDLFWPTHRRLSDGYENSRRLTDAYGHIYKKKLNFVIFGRFKTKNPRAVGSNSRILDRNVVVCLLSCWNLSKSFHLVS